MTFLEPFLLLGLLLVPVLLGLYVWAQRRRARYAVRFTNLDLLANLAPRRPAWRRHVPPVVYLAAVAALVLGLARPSMVVAVPREDATVILAIDVSGSMQATDVAPSRLDAAREAAADFVEQLPDGIRVGIVAFASRAVTLVQPTADRAAVATALDGLEALDGTAMGDGLMRLLDLAEAIQQDQADAAVDEPVASAGAGCVGGARRLGGARHGRGWRRRRPAGGRDPAVGWGQLGGHGRAARCGRTGRQPRRAHVHHRPGHARRPGHGP